jgi:hypothetical protein
MVLKFAEKELRTISFLVQPDASFVPPHELKEEDKQLEGFEWMAGLRPTKEQVVARPAATEPRPEPKPQASAVKAPAKKKKPNK